MKTKTSELSGAALNWAVAKAEGVQYRFMASRGGDYNGNWWWETRRYSTDWSQGGPIIEREGIRLHRGVGGYWWAATDEEPQRPLSAPSPLVAAMRCFVASKLGDEVEIPEELQ